MLGREGSRITRNILKQIETPGADERIEGRRGIPKKKTSPPHPRKGATNSKAKRSRAPVASGLSKSGSHQTTVGVESLVVCGGLWRRCKKNEKNRR